MKLSHLSLNSVGGAKALSLNSVGGAKMVEVKND